MAEIGVVIVILLVLVVGPIAILVLRLRAGGEPVAGGSMGRQLFRRDDDWGPKSTKGV